jgi:hypothetical protein
VLDDEALPARSFIRRHATTASRRKSHGGLKPTAMFMRSLRDGFPFRTAAVPIRPRPMGPADRLAQTTRSTSWNPGSTWPPSSTLT